MYQYFNNTLKLLAIVLSLFCYDFFLDSECSNSLWEWLLVEESDQKLTSAFEHFAIVIFHES